MHIPHSLTTIILLFCLSRNIAAVASDSNAAHPHSPRANAALLESVPIDEQRLERNKRHDLLSLSLSNHIAARAPPAPAAKASTAKVQKQKSNDDENDDDNNKNDEDGEESDTHENRKHNESGEGGEGSDDKHENSEPPDPDDDGNSSTTKSCAHRSRSMSGHCVASATAKSHATRTAASAAAARTSSSSSSSSSSTSSAAATTTMTTSTTAAPAVAPPSSSTTSPAPSSSSPVAAVGAGAGLDARNPFAWVRRGGGSGVAMTVGLYTMASFAYALLF